MFFNSIYIYKKYFIEYLLILIISEVNRVGRIGYYIVGN